MIKILLADDHKMFLNGLKMLLSSNEEISIVDSVQDGLQVLETLKNQDIDIILMDINMPVLNGYNTTLKLREGSSSVKIIILSMLADEHSVLKLMEAGADGYLFKNADEEELILAIKTVYSGGIYITKEIRDRLQLNKKIANSEKNTLSSREKDIALLIIEGLTNAEIADKLFLSFRTVETHRKNILAKLGLKNTASLVKYLIENKPFWDL